LIQQRIRHVYQWQRPTPLPGGLAEVVTQPQFGVDGLHVAHARRLGSGGGVDNSSRSTLFVVVGVQVTAL